MPGADAVTLSPQALVDAAANRPTIVAPAKNVLTPLERAAVSVAAQSAATEQDSLAPLFANLGAAVSSGNLPPKLQQAIAQVLAQQTSLDQNLDGGDIKTAFQKSGIFLEASLAAGAVPSSGAPDLKAALIVLRQTLQSALGADGSGGHESGAGTGRFAECRTPGLVPAGDCRSRRPRNPAAAGAAACRSGDCPNARWPAGRARPGAQFRTERGRDHEPAAGSAAATRHSRATGNTMPKAAAGDDVTVHTNTPPPPFRGASPTAQPVALPSLAPDAPLATTAHHLLDDTDAAIARQTLLQVASLPDRIDVTGPKIDATTPRWNFEIPFVTPQGTAMAQFEIARDGGAGEAEAAKRVWRARFSLDVEPTGPIHALVSLVGEKTSVRMWAERPATAAQLRAGASELSQALTRAELQPGEIVIRDGAPPQAAPAKAGHFLDRAL